MESSNIEIEVKVLEKNHKDFENKLFDLWAKKIFDWVLTAIFVKNEIWKEVRIRDSWNDVIIEHKIPLETDLWGKVMRELGLEAKSIEEAVDFFEAVWFNVIRKNIKRRVSYLISWNEWSSDIQFDFDKYTYLDWKEIPEFLEIESDNIEAIYEYANKLWIDKKDLLNWNARELSEYYNS